MDQSIKTGFIDCKTGEDITFGQVDKFLPSPKDLPPEGKCIPNLHTYCGIWGLRDIPVINAIPLVGRDCVTPEKAVAKVMAIQLDSISNMMSDMNNMSVPDQ